MAHLSRWLEGQRLGAGELTPQRLEHFVGARDVRLNSISLHKAGRRAIPYRVSAARILIS